MFTSNTTNMLVFIKLANISKVAVRISDWMRFLLTNQQYQSINR